MIEITPHHRSRVGLIARRLAILALPAALAVGCSDSDTGPPHIVVATATPTQATATATRTSTPTPSRTATPTATTPPVATATPTMPSGGASAACQKLEGCDQCFINQTGQCIPTDACAQRLSDDVAICINGITGCNANTLGDCLFLGCDGSDATGDCE